MHAKAIKQRKKRNMRRSATASLNSTFQVVTFEMWQWRIHVTISKKNHSAEGI